MAALSISILWEEYMNIVIIDSGIESRYNAEIKHRIHFTLDHSNAIIGNEATDDKVGHGTFVYRLVKQYCNDDISIIKILNEENQCNYNVLLYALRYSLEIGAKVVILCLATLTYDNRLDEVISEMYQKNIVVISSLMNGEKFSYPASQNKVIGVKGLDIENDRLFYYNKEDNIEVICSGESLYSLNQHSQLIRFGGNSKATAQFACMLIKMMVDVDTQSSIRDKLQQYSGENILPELFRKKSEASISELIDKVYEKSYNLHQLDRTEFMKTSVWSFFDNMEDVSKFIKIIMDECRVNNAMFRERDFVCIKDMLTNMIFCL